MVMSVIAHITHVDSNQWDFRNTSVTFGKQAKIIKLHTCEKYN